MAEAHDALVRFEAGLKGIADAYGALFSGARDEPALRAANAKFLGPKGSLTELLRLMPELPKERRKDLGSRANEVKREVEAAFAARLAEIESAARQADLQSPAIDVTLPGRAIAPGALHPLTQVQQRIIATFRALGFDVADGPEVELYENNFDRLGFPPDHPATDMQDSFYVAGPTGGARRLLRTHTSTIQVREMLARKPPLAVVATGAVYRRDDDITHSPMFFQVEGFMVDRDVRFSHLKGALTEFIRQMFGANVAVRFRPSYFPFVEPGGELDMGCIFCSANPQMRSSRAQSTTIEPCRVCKGTGWLEILGCGMIHPVVFERVGYDPEDVSGFAFGMGVDRIAMSLYGISDIRDLYGGDVRFLSQF